MSNDPFFGYILAAYLIGFAVITFMIFATLLEHRSLKQKLSRLSARTGRSIED